MKKTFVIVAVLVVIALGAFFYATRAPSAPSADVSAVADKLSATSSAVSIYRIGSTGSKVSFRIHEVLNGSKNTVIGTTDQIAGDIRIAADSISTGEIKVSGRTFKTDTAARDGVIDRFILKAEDPQNEFIRIAPLSATTSPAIGATATFSATTTVTIAGVSKPVSFSIIARNEGDKLIAVVEANLKRSDFGLTIPSVPFVADVDDALVVDAQITAPVVR